jgi:hypothetical protein
MKPCRECKREVSEQAFSCPNCGAPYPAKEQWDGWGYEYKSNLSFFGLPLLHISFKYRPNRRPVVAIRKERDGHHTDDLTTGNRS